MRPLTKEELAEYKSVLYELRHLFKFTPTHIERYEILHGVIDAAIMSAKVQYQGMAGPSDIGGEALEKFLADNYGMEIGEGAFMDTFPKRCENEYSHNPLRGVDPEMRAWLDDWMRMRQEERHRP